MKKLCEENNIATYHNHRAEPYFTFVKNGVKTIEGRIKKGWYCKVRPGDYIIIYNKEETDSVKVQVRAVRFYDSIKEMLGKEDLNKLLPNVKTINEGIEVYKRFYTPEQEKAFGVVAIEIEKLD